MALLTTFANLTVANLTTTATAGVGNLDINGSNITLANTASETSITLGSQTGGRVQVNPSTNLSYVHAIAPSISQESYDNTAGFTSASWTSSGIEGLIVFAGATQSFQNWINDNYGFYNNRTVSINNDQVTGIVVTGWSVDSGISQIILYVATPPTVDPTTVTQVTFVNVFNSELLIDNDEGMYQLQAAGLLALRTVFNNDIELSAGDDIRIRGGDKGIAQGSEGGDIRIDGGDGSPDDGTDTSGSGGDITIAGGAGGAANVFGASTGGGVNIRAGQGGGASSNGSAGDGGILELYAGDAGFDGSNAALGGTGGQIYLYAGQTTLGNQRGGNVFINSGSAGPNSSSGDINLIVPPGGTSAGYQWTFGGDGILSLPGGVLVDSSDNNFEVRSVNNVNFEASSDVNVYTNNGSHQWTFGSNGDLRFPRDTDANTDPYLSIVGGSVPEISSVTAALDGPANLNISADYLNITGYTANRISIFSDNGEIAGSANIVLATNGGNSQWNFTTAPLDPTEALLYAPAGATITTPLAPSGEDGKNINIEAGSVDQQNYNTNAGGEVFIRGGRGGFNDGGGGGPGGNVNINAGDSADPAGHAGNVYVTAGALQNWVFDYTGNLTLPGNTFAVNYANGNAVPLGGGANTGNVTFSNVTVQGDNSLLNLSAGPDFTSNLAFLRLRAGDVASHIHLDTGNNDAYDLIIGDDQNYVQVSSTGNILLSSYDSNTGQYTWTMDINGNLTVPGNVIANAGGASPAPSLSGFSSLSSIDSITTGGTITALRDVVKNGDDATGTQNKTQLQFGYNNSTDYSQYIATRHNNSNVNNAILFYTSDGTQAGTFPANAVLGLTVNDGKVGAGNVAFPGNTLDVGGSVYANGNITAARYFGDGSTLSNVALSSGGVGNSPANVQLGNLIARIAGTGSNAYPQITTNYAANATFVWGGTMTDFANAAIANSVVGVGSQGTAVAPGTWANIAVNGAGANLALPSVGDTCQVTVSDFDNNRSWNVTFQRMPGGKQSILITKIA